MENNQNSHELVLRRVKWFKTLTFHKISVLLNLNYLNSKISDSTLNFPTFSQFKLTGKKL